MGVVACNTSVCVERCEKVDVVVDTIAADLWTRDTARAAFVDESIAIIVFAGRRCAVAPWGQFARSIYSIKLRQARAKLDRYRGRDVRKIAVKADNKVQPGLDMVRWGFSPPSMPELNKDRPRDGPQLFIVRDSLRHGRDEDLASELKPTCLTQELPSYVFVKNEDGKAVTDNTPDPTCADHGIDAMRYAMMYAWKKDRVARKHAPMFNEGTYGHLLGHEAILKGRRD